MKRQTHGHGTMFPMDTSALRGRGMKRRLAPLRDRVASLALSVANRASGRTDRPLLPGETHLVLDHPPNRTNVPRWGQGVAPPHPLLARRLADQVDEFADHID